MDRLRDVLNGTWAGNYTYNSNPAFRPQTRMEITSQISPNTGNLEVNGSGRDGFGAYTLKGSAKSPTEISCVKSFGWRNEWWHTATVDIDGRQMNGKWGPALAPNQVNGTFSFRRQITEADRQREAAAQKLAEETRKREEEAAAAAARQKQQEEEAARKKQLEVEEAAKKKQEEEEQEAARKQKEEAEAAKKRAEEAEAARKKQEEEQEAARKEREVAERARQQAADAERKRKEADDKQKEAERNQSMQEAAGHRPQDPPPVTKEKGKLIVSPQDPEDGVAGNSKVYLKVDLDADIRVIATLKGDVAIGIL
jgi:chemotaxis protein histidine kinase CheA